MKKAGEVTETGRLGYENWTPSGFGVGHGFWTGRRRFAMRRMGRRGFGSKDGLFRADEFEGVVVLVELDAVVIEKPFAAEQHRHIGVNEYDRCHEGLSLMFNAQR
jgi:hypothetical protein